MEVAKLVFKLRAFKVKIKGVFKQVTLLLWSPIVRKN